MSVPGPLLTFKCHRFVVKSHRVNGARSEMAQAPADVSMIDWMPNILKRALTRLLKSSSAPSKKAANEAPFMVNGRPIYGSDLYRQIVEEDQKARLAEDAEAARKRPPNLG